MQKPGRNDPCPCGSGKKFKKCCEKQMLGGRFKATRIEPNSVPLIQKTAGLTSLFQSRLSETPKKPMPSAQEPDASQLESPRENRSIDEPLEKKEDI